MVISFILLGILLVVFLYAVLLYNGLVQLKHNVAQAWSNIDVLLKQRHEELPKLIETCKQYMKHERDVLEKVTHARAAVGTARERGDIEAVGYAEAAMRAGLASLFAVAENYPQLKANQTFQHLQTRISQLESQIADRREFYNDSVNANNVRIEQFPEVLVARAFNFRPRPLLRFSEAELKDVDIKQLFAS